MAFFFSLISHGVQDTFHEGIRHEQLEDGGMGLPDKKGSLRRCILDIETIETLKRLCNAMLFHTMYTFYNPFLQHVILPLPVNLHMHRS